MAWNRKNQTVEDLVIIVGLVMVQFVYAGNSVLLSYLMSIGLNPLTIVIFSTSATFLILSPIAVHFERSLSLFLIKSLSLSSLSLYISIYLYGR